MARSIVLGSSTSSKRDAWWYLEQEGDGSLFVSYENDDDHSDDWRKPLSEVLAGSPSDSAKRGVEDWIGGMMDKRDEA